MDEPTAAAVDWLLGSDEPAIRHMARRGVTRLYVQTFADDVAQIEEKLSHLM